MFTMTKERKNLVRISLMVDPDELELLRAYIKESDKKYHTTLSKTVRHWMVSFNDKYIRNEK